MIYIPVKDNCRFRTILKAFSRISLLACSIVLASSTVCLAQDAGNSKLLTGGVEGKASIEPSVKVIQPVERKPGLSGTRIPRPDIQKNYSIDDFRYERERQQLRRLKKLKRKQRKMDRRKARGYSTDPVSSYRVRRTRSTASYPGKRYSVRSSEQLDAIWMRKLSKRIYGNNSWSYLPHFGDVDGETVRKKRNKKRRKAGANGHSIYSSRNKMFLSPGYSVSYITTDLEESKIAGRWFVPEEKPVGLLARAQRLGDPLFVQPVVAQPLEVVPEFHVAPETEGLIWSSWYKDIARSIYNQWSQFEVGPGAARVQIKVRNDGRILARIVEFKPAPFVTSDGINESAFRQAVVNAIARMNRRPIPPFPITNKKQVIFEVVMKRSVEGRGIEIESSDNREVDRIMNLIDNLPYREQQKILKELSVE